MGGVASLGIWKMGLFSADYIQACFVILLVVVLAGCLFEKGSGKEGPPEFQAFVFIFLLLSCALAVLCLVGIEYGFGLGMGLL
jgi:hypothetical protein